MKNNLVRKINKGGMMMRKEKRKRDDDAETGGR